MPKSKKLTPMTARTKEDIKVLGKKASLTTYKAPEPDIKVKISWTMGERPLIDIKTSTSDIMLTQEEMAAIVRWYTGDPEGEIK